MNTTEDIGRDEFVLDRTEIGTVFRNAIDPERYGVLLNGSCDRIRWFHTLAAALNAVHKPVSLDAPTEIEPVNYETMELEKKGKAA